MPSSIEGNNDLHIKMEDLIPLSKAADISGLTVQHLALIIRQGKLWGDKMGGPNWFTTEDAVSQYLARDRRPGPKPQKGQ